MRLAKLAEMKDGWFIGGFVPSVFRTGEFEVGFKQHKKGEDWPCHYQLKAVEINCMVRGILGIGDQLFYSGDIFVVEPLESVKPVFFTDVEVIVVKVPSLPLDKVLA